MTTDRLSQVAGFLGLASAAAILLSISASQVLLGLAVVALLLSRQSWRLPRIWLPLALFLAGTLLSMATSPHPSHGLPQVKKMFVFAILPVLFTTLPDLRTARRLFLCWGGIGAAVAAIGAAQFALKWQQAQQQHLEFYKFYVLHRVTGTMSHWMTFAGQEMAVLLMLLAYLFFGQPPSRRIAVLWWGAALLLGVALLLNGTRTVWLGAGVAGIWLAWQWRRWAAVAAPLAILTLMWLIPGPVHERLRSIVRPQKEIDSNEFRYIAFRSGLRMIADHPILGIGLDETKYRFLDYIPADVPRPLPSGFYQHLHNFYLQFAAERGIPTLLMLLWMLAMSLYDFGRALAQLPPGPGDARFLLSGGIAVTIGIMLSGLFEVNLGDSEVLTVFLVAIACAYRAVNAPGVNAPA